VPHAIRLRDPWKQELRAGGGTLFTRHFHRPTGLDDSSRVWLVIEGVTGAAEVTLNDRRLEGSGPIVRCDFTAELRPNNLLAIAVGSISGKEQPFGVRLEIE
jgi:hypothetical protein